MQVEPWAASPKQAPNAGPADSENPDRPHGICTEVTPTDSSFQALVYGCVTKHIKHRICVLASEGTSLTLCETQPESRTNERGDAVTEVTKLHRETQMQERLGYCQPIYKDT